MLTRREWLSGALAALAGACSSEGNAARKDGDGGPSDGGASPDGGLSTDAATEGGGPGDVFARQRALLDALRRSPDHLRARADAAVAARDPRKLFEFVRDEIAVVPPFEPIESIETAIRFGVGNVLRSGMGTPRERAELLADLLGRAGFAASVVKGSPEGPLFSPDAPKAVYLRATSRLFEPGDLPFAPDPGAEVPALVDVDGADSAALFATLRPLLPAGAVVNTQFLAGFSDMPFVALESGGSTVHLNTLLVDATYGQSYATGITGAKPLAPARRVTLRLTATRARAPEEPVTLVEAEFGYDELAGARVKLSPQPTLPLPVFLASKALEVTNFVAGFSLVGSDGVSKRYVRGTALSVFGDVVETASGTTSINGVPLAAGGDPSSVRSVTAKATATSAPTVELEVAPLDDGGTVVAGLSASDMVIEDDGVRVSAVLRENGGAARVLVLWDPTGSQPALTAATAGGIADSVFAAVPGATVQVTALDGAPSRAGFVLKTSADVKTALLTASGASSPVFDGLLSGIAAGATTIVIFTDGDDASMTGLASQCLAAARACPIVVIGCYAGTSSLKPELLTPIAAKSGGLLVDAGDLTDLTTTKAALGLVGSRRSSFPYRLAYTARGGAGKHTVTIRVGTASTTTDYTLTGTSAGPGAFYSELVGIQLHVEMDGTSADRTLVGLPAAALPPDRDSTTTIAAASKDIREFFLSSAWVTFEGGAPTLSAWLDDALSAAIGYEPVQRAVDANDAPRAYAAAETAKARPLLRSLLAHSPLPQPNGVRVVETMLRAAVHVTLPLSRRTSVDLLPTTLFRTLGAADGSVAFDTTFQASLRLALAESHMSKGSTLASLAKAPLGYLPPGTVSAADLTAFPASARGPMAALLNRYPGAHRIVAKDGSTRAFWAIDAATGSALGVLPDGTGGAIESCQEIVEFANEQIDLLGVLVGEIESGLASTFIFIAAVGKAAAVAVAEAALSFTDPLIDPSILQLGATMVCSMLSDFVGNALPGSTGSPLTHAGEAWLKSKAGGKIVDQLSICQAAAPCTKTAPP